jgi:hypothetical protein
LTWAAGTNAPGGSTTQVQYNNAGSFAGITGATTNGTALTLVAPVLGAATATSINGIPIFGDVGALGFYMTNAAGGIDTSDGGGSITTGQAGGPINTSGGGGAIDTAGTGSIELGVTGTRTTFTGAASGTNKSIALPNASGTLVLNDNTATLTNKTLTTPVILQINDATGNETLKLASIASAVNEVTIENGATGNAVHIRATGGDASIGLHLAGKGASGYVNVQDSVDGTKRILFNASGGTTSTRTMLSSTQTIDRTITLPDAAGTVVLNTSGNLATPGAIGGTTASTGAFTTLSGTSTLTLGVAGPTGTAGTVVLKNATNAHTTTIVPSVVAASRQLNLPLITGTDTVAVLGLEQTFSGNKTFSGTVSCGST